MYTRVTESDFVQAFDAVDRSNNFSIEARRVLFAWFEQLEEATEEDIELDPIAICCDWAEYDLDELKREYDQVKDCEDLDEALEVLGEETLVLGMTNNDTLIVEAF